MSCSSESSKCTCISVFAAIFGVIFLITGIFGFIPQLHEDNLIFGYLTTDGLTNLVRITFGLIGIFAASCPKASQNYFKLVGIVFLAFALFGFWFRDEAIFGVIANNFEASLIHLSVAVLALAIGFFSKPACHNH